MADSTAIEWCDATFNPWWGCEKVSPGCAHCYAEGISNHRSGKGNWGADHGFRFFGDKHWAEPLRWARNLPGKLGRRPRVFCASMADVFEEHPALEEPRRRLFDLIAETPELDWLILTKRPEVALEWMTARWRAFADGVVVSEGSSVHPYPPNVWMGVSIENARYTWRADVLREIPAAVRFISAEPLLGSLYPETFECPRCEGQRYDVGSCFLCANRGRLDERGSRDRMPLDLTGIDWVIIGGESGGGARPFHLEHAREIVNAARLMRQEASVGGDLVSHTAASLFVKQLGAKPIESVEAHARTCVEPDICPITRGETVGPVRLVLRDGKGGGDMSEWPADLRIREFPRSAVPA